MPPALRIIDSHTGGEPTRVVTEGLPAFDGSTCEAQRNAMQSTTDWVRTALTLEPRGAPWMVGAAVVRPSNPVCTAGVIFFNNVGYLGMCGHGLIGVVATLAHLQQIEPGLHRFETPVGEVATTLHDDGRVSIENVPSYRAAHNVALEVPELGKVVGDIAYGGNWFFLIEEPQLDADEIESLLTRTRSIMTAVRQQRLGAELGAAIDHIELCAAPSDRLIADSKNFVLCPGGQYDRSPCGTGTSAKVACLADSGKLRPGEVWRQESIIGSVFEASYRLAGGGVVPTITGRAFVTGDTTIVIDPDDPFARGIVN